MLCGQLVHNVITTETVEVTEGTVERDESPVINEMNMKILTRSGGDLANMSKCNGAEGGRLTSEHALPGQTSRPLNWKAEARLLIVLRQVATYAKVLIY